MNRGIVITFFLAINFTFQKEFLKLDVQNKNMRKLDEELSDDIVILHVNDVHCGLNDTIGYDGFVLYRDEMKKKYKNVITVDVGDHVQGGSIGAISGGEAIINLVNKIGFNVSILGNHEFDYGIEQLLKLRQNISSNYICSNFCYNKNKTRVFDPYKVITIGDKKIGFIGVLTPLTLTKTYLSSVKDNETKERLYDFLSCNNSTDLYDTVQKDINELRNNEKVNYVILLTHIGMEVEDYTSEDLLSHLENVDAVLDGHTHKVYNVTTKDKKQNNITIAQTGTKLQSIGKLIIKKDGSFGEEIIKKVPEPSDKKGAIKIIRGQNETWVDNETYQMINSIWNEYSDDLNAYIGKSDFDLIVEPSNAYYQICRNEECSIGNLIADAVKETGQGEVAIINGGGARSNLPKGNITSSIIYDILPWFSYVVSKQMPGQVIWDALEFGVSKIPNAFGGYPQISGITFDLDPSINSTVKTDKDGHFINVTGERRVTNVKINGKDLNLTKMYNVSLLEFIANGGDGYSMFENYSVYYESTYTDTDSLIYYIKNQLNGIIPEKYKEVEGRVNIKNSQNSSTLVAFKDYNFNSTSNLIRYLVYLMLDNFSNVGQKNVTMKLNIDYQNNLRFLEEEDVTCIYKDKMEKNLYVFDCSKQVKGPVASMYYVENSLKLDGLTLPNSDELPCNLTNRATNSFTVEGENSKTNLSSKDCYLYFNDNNKTKKIPCVIEDEGSSKFKVICKPESKVNVDLSNNNYIVIEDLNKSLKMAFEKEGNSITNSKVGINPFKPYKKSSGGLSGGTIVAIILPIVAALAIIGALIFLIGHKSTPNPPLESLQRIPNTSSPDIKITK